ncbi:MAG: acyl-CoA/acyl-ACP dehydrogenase [Candidatus Wildermuthbacteria bacterium]|nr:acyl-CoA/acyl-ACP dehydrogenase [Candidatus Wildermuthbacteria bacterium]
MLPFMVFPTDPAPEPAISAAKKSALFGKAVLAARTISQQAAYHDRSGTFPENDFRLFQQLGLLRLAIPKKNGGLSTNALTQALCMVKIAEGNASSALALTMHTAVCAFVSVLGSPGQRGAFFKNTVQNGALFAAATSEPGSSFSGKFLIGTTFHQEPGGYRVTGTKQFCTLAGVAEHYLVSGLLDTADTPEAGFLSALIPARDVCVQKHWNVLAMRATSSHNISFDAFVPNECVIGTSGEIVRKKLFRNFGLMYASVYLGVGIAALEYLKANKKTEENAEEVLLMENLARAGENLIAQAALAFMADDKNATRLMLQAKYFCTELSLWITQRAMRIVGGNSIRCELPLERWTREALIGPIMPPSTERILKIRFGEESPPLEFAKK